MSAKERAGLELAIRPGAVLLGSRTPDATPLTLSKERLTMRTITLLLLLALCVGGCTSPTAPEPTPPSDGLLIQIMDDGSILVIRT